MKLYRFECEIFEDALWSLFDGCISGLRYVLIWVCLMKLFQFEFVWNIWVWKWNCSMVNGEYRNCRKLESVRGGNVKFPEGYDDMKRKLWMR